MLNPPLLFPPTRQFWRHCAREIIRSHDGATAARDFSALRVLVPAFEHAHWLMRAMQAELGCAFIAPRINTLSVWLDMQLPAVELPVSDGERLMALYAQLREHGWLKKLFAARKNTDLLPLAQTLITLSDELTLALLPQGEPLQQKWQQALAQLTLPNQQLLSDEAQLVWQIWQSQLDGRDAVAMRLERLLALARGASDALVWISPVAPEGLDLQFLLAYARTQPVRVVGLDWRSSAVEAIYNHAWQELTQPDGVAVGAEMLSQPASRISLLAADGLEQEAQLGAQTIIDWCQAGYSRIALVAQDRVVARRIRALLERAGVQVADETGWKLSTTRAASVLAAWFDVIVTRADTYVLLDLLKSPYFNPDGMGAVEDKSDWVMRIEFTLLRAKALGGWEAIGEALCEVPECAAMCSQLRRSAEQYVQRKTLRDWLELTRRSLSEFGMMSSWQTDAAGQHMVQLLERLDSDCASLGETFSFAEWRVFINLQLEGTPFQASRQDQRVVMLPLNGARLRQFDAVLMAGCDARHLPSQPQEVLFFTNAVRRECGLITREQRGRQQLRDFTELLSVNPEIVLSWQHQQRGEDNPVSPWIARLNLCLQKNGLLLLPSHDLTLPALTLASIIPRQPAPQAAALIPNSLSASGYNVLIACPYQFFATRMLGLSGIETLSDLPEKRDYGGWLHAILKTYHTLLKDQPALSTLAQQQTLLSEVSQAGFAPILRASPAALGMSKRWEKVIPAYVAWSHAYGAAGWQFEMGELWLERTLDWGQGTIRLRGQVDRIDRHQDGQWAVLDYKTTTKTALNKKLQLAEDQQLPFYGLLARSGDHGLTQIDAACYVPLETTSEKIDQVSATDYAAWQQDLQQAIAANLTTIAQGGGLTAQGTTKVCAYCDVRGLCRKGAW